MKNRVAAPLDTSPARYIVKLDRHTGDELPDPVEPAELLVHAHRYQNPVSLVAQFLASRLIQLTGSERLARGGLKAVRSLARIVGDTVGRLTGAPDRGRRTKQLLGVTEDDVVFRFRNPTRLSEPELKTRIDELQRQARRRLAERGTQRRLHVLLTGATGFLGQEIVTQMAADHRIREVVAVIRPETLRDRKTGAPIRTLSPRQRGAALLERLQLGPRAARKFRFVRGDVEKPAFGMARAERARLRRQLTHVVHCAANVSFDDSYESLFRANVVGSRNAAAFSLELQRAAGSRFVSHVAIETSYIHGRRARAIARESSLDFPRHFYNNFYELTKAMASIETDRALVEEGLRVVQILPSIIIGHSRSGKNHGDAKVVNAPVNAFGRAREALEAAHDGWLEKARALLVGSLATSFPADRSAELNLVPVDRVAQGILAALHIPEAIGNRIHLATDNRIRSEQMARISREELGVDVHIVDPTLTRHLLLPLARTVLRALDEPRLASALEKLEAVFGLYSEWGQPIHDVGNDVGILRLPARRPDTADAFRMLCRHNRFVQEFGKLRSLEEIARREAIWVEAVDEIEFEAGRPVARLSARDFERRLRARIDLESFRPRTSDDKEGA